MVEFITDAIRHQIQLTVSGKWTLAILIYAVGIVHALLMVRGTLLIADLGLKPRMMTVLHINSTIQIFGKTHISKSFIGDSITLTILALPFTPSSK